jgi:hypothetical protein
MENQTRFNLNHAIGAWKQELTNQSGVTAEEARELETHLSEYVATLKNRGLSDEQAFKSAIERTGSPETIVAEFAKLNPLRNWRGRVYWMAFAGLAIPMGATALFMLQMVFFRSFQPENGMFTVWGGVLVLGFLPLLAIALAVTGRTEAFFRQLQRLSHNRWLLLTMTVTVLLALHAARLWSEWNHPRASEFLGPEYNKRIVWILLNTLIGISINYGPFIALMVWLAPSVGQSGIDSEWKRPTGQKLLFCRERVFWMAIGALAVDLFSMLGDAGRWLLMLLAVDFKLVPDSILRHDRLFMLAVQFALFGLPVLLGAILAARGKFRGLSRIVSHYLHRRWRIAFFGVIPVIACLGLEAVSVWRNSSTVLLAGYYAFSPAVCVACITWLAPLPPRGRSAVVV